MKNIKCHVLFAGFGILMLNLIILGYPYWMLHLKTFLQHGAVVQGTMALTGFAVGILSGLFLMNWKKIRLFYLLIGLTSLLWLLMGNGMIASLCGGFSFGNLLVSLPFVWTLLSPANTEQ